MGTSDNHRSALTAIYCFAGAAICVVNLAHADVTHHNDFLVYLLCAAVAALGLRSTHRNAIPVVFLVLLLGIEDLSLSELIFIACVVSLLGQIRESGRARPRPLALGLSVASGGVGIAAAEAIHQYLVTLKYNVLFPAPLVASSLILLLNLTLVRALGKDGSFSFKGMLQECRPLLPWFVGLAYLASLVRSASILNGMNAGVVTLPMLFALDSAFRAWFVTKEKHREELASLQKKSLENLAALHQRTLETLAVAINGRDRTTQMHLRRVQFYVRAVGEDLKLSAEELEHLNVAALLHDIGKLGIPDHILLKPGPLSPEEWEKMKTHPLTGAEMLARMNFPEQVLEIVATHHEKWDGKGYPRGLKGDQIPIGSRILSAVDCLDALASDRPYRGALTIDMAMARVSKEEGRSFDPQVVSVLQRRYADLERLAWGEVTNNGAEAPDTPSSDLGKLSATLNAESNPAANANSILDPIVSARQETQRLQTLATALTHSLGASEVTAAIHQHVKELIAHDTLAIYVTRDNTLEPIEIVGDNSHLFSRDPFPIEKGLSGRVIQHKTAILNGDPCMEFGFNNDSVVVYKLQSALAVLMKGPKGMLGVITLYQKDLRSFNRDHLRLLEAVSLQVAPAIESALRYHDTEKMAVTDHLTGLPNARSLELHLHRELSRAQREDSTVGVLVCDLNGFKGVNDRFGHLKGNEVLQVVAKGLQEVCRKSDYVARMGDEFVIVSPGLREDLSVSYTERLQTVARAAGWSVCNEQCLSMAVGTAIYPIDGSGAEVLLAEADRRMYSAKPQGSRREAPRPAEVVIEERVS